MTPPSFPFSFLSSFFFWKLWFYDFGLYVAVLVSVRFSSVAQSCPTLCDLMDCSMPGFPVHHQLLEPTNSCPLHRWCHPTISSSVVPFSSRLQSFPASGSFPVSRFFASGGQSIGVSASASVLPMNIQNWFPLGLTGLILDFSVFFSIYIQLVKSYTFYFKNKQTKN